MVFLALFNLSMLAFNTVLYSLTTEPLFLIGMGFNGLGYALTATYK